MCYNNIYLNCIKKELPYEYNRINWKKEKFNLELLDEHMKVASSTECTGLIQIPPTNEEESEAYRDIYVVPEQVTDYGKVNKPKGRAIKSAPDKK